MDKRVLVFDYYYGMEAEQFTFYRIPRMLVKDERFRKLSCEAKLLYGLMMDRLALSMQNGWLDDELIYVASIPGSKIYRQVMPQDVSEAYENYIDLCKDQIRDTYHNIRALTERQETMNRIMTCYKVLPKREHQILQIMYEENGSFTVGMIAATSELNIGRTTVMRWRRRALASIKRLL